MKKSYKLHRPKNIITSLKPNFESDSSLNLSNTSESSIDMVIDLEQVKFVDVTFFYQGVLTRSQAKTRSTTPPVMEKPKCPNKPKRNKL